jgi:hypothetical protein
VLRTQGCAIGQASSSRGGVHNWTDLFVIVSAESSGLGLVRVQLDRPLRHGGGWLVWRVGEEQKKGRPDLLGVRAAERGKAFEGLVGVDYIMPPMPPPWS